MPITPILIFTALSLLSLSKAYDVHTELNQYKNILSGIFKDSVACTDANTLVEKVDECINGSQT